MKKYIEVEREEFEKILETIPHVKAEVKGNWDWCSESSYDIITIDGKIGHYKVSSWGQWYFLIPSLVSRQDIIDDYESDLAEQERTIADLRKALKEQYAYRKLSPEDRLRQDLKKVREEEERKKHPGVFTFMGNTNIIKYDPFLKNDQFRKTLDAIVNYKNKKTNED